MLLSLDAKILFKRIQWISHGDGNYEVWEYIGIDTACASFKYYMKLLFVLSNKS